jgi:hypothetical protein
MKQMRIILIGFLLGMTLQPVRLKAQSYEAQQLLLDWEKLSQLKQILNDLYKGYEIVSKGYTAIKDISQGNFNIHQVFLDGLLQVSPAIQKYKKVVDIILNQLQIVKGYKAAFNRFKQDDMFTSEEISYIGKVYSNLLNESLKGLDDLITVITAGSLRMTDDERLNAIDKIYDRISGQLSFLRSFNNSTAILSIQRMKEKQEVDISRKLQNINQ